MTSSYNNFEMLDGSLSVINVGESTLCWSVSFTVAYILHSEKRGIKTVPHGVLLLQMVPFFKGALFFP